VRFRQGLKPVGHVGELVKHITGFERVVIEIEEREADLVNPVFAGLAVASGFNEGAVRVREVEFPAAIRG
jgi:hypothetical protein